MTDALEPVVLMDQDPAAKTVEPLVACLINQVVLDEGLDAVRGLLPIDVRVSITLHSGGRMFAMTTCESQCDHLEP
jgi:hypothetical protein